MSQSRKRKNLSSYSQTAKRARGSSESSDDENEQVAGKIKRVFMKNFMCHNAMEVKLNQKINFIVGANGSGKSAILTALTIGLGARAKDTSRGNTLKAFIKQGKSSASVEITVTNNGPMAYKYEVYGDSITIIRTIGASSSYKIKNWLGDVISTKRDELNNIISALNIQVDNPISVLNQDVSRTFLTSSNSSEKYKLFMKATRLDIIGDNYRQAKIASEEVKEKLEETKKILSDEKKKLDQLKKKLRTLETLDDSRKEYSHLEKELLWAEVIHEEKDLFKIDDQINRLKNQLKEFENAEQTKAVRENEIDKKIIELKSQLDEAETEAKESHEKLNELKNICTEAKRVDNEKKEKVRSLHGTIERHEQDILKLQEEIKRYERENNAAGGDRRQQAKQKIEECEQQLDEVEATLRTRQTDLMHLEENKNRIKQEDHKLRIDLDQKNRSLNKLKQSLNGFKNQPNEELTVYGQNMPRLLKRIDEEYRRGRFQHKPVGPVGSYIKLKDQSWIPAIENHLGQGTLTSFCVDNNKDARTLDLIMKEVFRGDRVPQVVISKFFDRMHDVSRGCCTSPRYQNLLQAMEISHPVIANNLIDQREIECILLIPTSTEACEVMSSERHVPRNCKRAITKQADLFYPAPEYRTYGGSVSRPKFLQVSTSEAIQSLQEEIGVSEDEVRIVEQQYSEVRERMKRNEQELSQAQIQVRSLKDKQMKLKEKITENNDIIESCNNNVINTFMTEVEELQRRVEQKKDEENRLIEEQRQAHKQYEEHYTEYKKYRNLVHNPDAKLIPIKDHIKDLQDEKKRLNIINKGSNRKIEDTNRELQKIMGDHQQQQRVVNAKTEIAEKASPRIETSKKPNDIRNRLKELKFVIEAVEKEHGTKDALVEELTKKDESYQSTLEFAIELERSNLKHHNRLLERKTFYSEMKKEISKRVQDSFENVLKLRKYSGSIQINHSKKELDLEVTPSADEKRINNDAKCLSGGERSYSTVAFVLALWDCTGLPFYFLDEFDVFMDKVNRHIIMDILLDYAKSHPESQFAFLTPLDTSHIVADDTITIHRLSAPERSI